MQDIEEAIRYSHGRDRIRLMRQRERMSTIANTQRQQMQRDEERGATMHEWSEEDRQHALEHLKEDLCLVAKARYNMLSYATILRGAAMSTYQAAYVEQIRQEVRHTPDEYLPALLEIIRLFRQSITLKTAEESFKQGWQEAMRGETMPVSDLWVGIDAE